MVGFPSFGNSGVLPYGVSSTTVAGLSAVARSLDVLGTGVSQLPWKEHRGTLDLPLSRLTRQPVAFYTRREWTQLVVRTMALHDVCYLLKLDPEDSEGVPNGLWPIPPNIIIPRTVDTYALIPPAQYTVGKQTIDAERLVIIRRGPMPGIPDYLSGVLNLARAEFASYLSAENYASRYWQGGGAPVTVLETDANLSDTQATSLGNRWSQRRAQGPDHPAVLSNGLKAKEWGADPTTQSAVEARRDMASAVFRHFGIPPRLGNAPNLDAETYANAQEANIDLLHYTLENYINAIEDAITGLLPGGREMSMITSQLTEGTQLTRYQAYQLAVGAPWMTAAEARDAEGLPPQELPDVDESQRPLVAASIGGETAQIAAATGRPNP